MHVYSAFGYETLQMCLELCAKDNVHTFHQITRMTVCVLLGSMGLTGTPGEVCLECFSE